MDSRKYSFFPYAPHFCPDSRCRPAFDAPDGTKPSFAPPKDLTLGSLQIDGVTIKNIVGGHRDLAAAWEITIALHGNCICTVAEFVDADDTCATMRENGVDYAHGFGFHTPGPIAQAS